ncbi:thioesterase family protein [Balneolaceae bacterium ANBcel3]|nr:thioesterase family protein [Balneolaceae bacterium ANBcel3]
MLPDQKPILTFSHTLRSRYSETDKMGVVYHSRYLEYFEVIRTEFIRQAGLSYREMEDSGIMLPVSNVEMSFRKPFYYDELIVGTLSIFNEPAIRLVTYYELRGAEETSVRVSGKVTLVFVGVQHRRPVRAPVSFLNKLYEYAKMAG